jgi:1-deoxy-D-xylulose-5-phosphate reductoisomerase
MGLNDKREVGPRRVSILGATGSVGRSTLDVVARNPDRFSVAALTAQSNVEALASAAVAHRAELAVIGDPALYGALKERLAGSGIRVGGGPDALDEAGSEPADCVVAAIVGVAGLKPTLAAVRQGTRVALANKECLVSAGDHFMAEVKRCRAELVPVDSEHSGVLQCLAGIEPGDVARIILTASGGPFRTWRADAIEAVTIEQALKHPNWAMGQKITIDSATMMNKGLELIEAHHLFAVSADKLDVIVHPQSIVHAIVEIVDGSVMAQLASHDMRLPIALSLSWPQRMPTPVKRLDLAALKSLEFEDPDEKRFPALALARSALRRGGGATTVLNGANEAAVGAFLEQQLSFPGIAAVVGDVLERAERQGSSGLVESADQALALDGQARRMAAEAIAARKRS